MGLAWGSSLFEDNAEYGLVGLKDKGQIGSKFSVKGSQFQQPLLEFSAACSGCGEIPYVKLATQLFADRMMIANATGCSSVWGAVATAIPAGMGPAWGSSLFEDNAEIWSREDMLRTTSQWIIGGDGWAYDIGFGGLDHVLSLSGENVNLMVLDTEMHSNTAKTKKNLPLHAINHEQVYVASVAVGANYAQCVQAFKEAESYPGPSLILAYSPCIDWGFDMKYMMDVQKQAVDCGYWTLYRYDPRRVDQGLNPFQLDSKRVRADLAEWVKGQNRFARLTRENKERAGTLQALLKEKSMELHHKYERLAMDDESLLEDLMSKMGVTVHCSLMTNGFVSVFSSEHFTGDRNGIRLVTGGQYGLASKEFTPAMAKSVFDNLNDPKPKMRYVIGVEDDVTHTSLSYSHKPLNTAPEGTSQALIYGLGGDGMVGASQTMIQLICENTNLNAQGYFAYDSNLRSVIFLPPATFIFGAETESCARSWSAEARH